MCGTSSAQSLAKAPAPKFTECFTPTLAKKASSRWHSSVTHHFQMSRTLLLFLVQEGGTGRGKVRKHFCGDKKEPQEWSRWWDCAHNKFQINDWKPNTLSFSAASTTPCRLPLLEAFTFGFCSRKQILSLMSPYKLHFPEQWQDCWTPQLYRNTPQPIPVCGCVYDKKE